MPYIENDRLQRLGLQLLETRENIKHQVNKVEFLKDQLYRELMEIGVGQATIKLSIDEEMTVKNNLRFSKAFDKEAFSGKVNLDRTEVDYTSISGLVERGRITSKDVAKYQSENRSEFVTVRKKKVKAAKSK